MRKYVQAFKISDGKHAYGPQVRDNVTADYLARFKANADEKSGEHTAVYMCDEADSPEGGAALTATTDPETGEVTSVAPAPVPPILWVHVTLTPTMAPSPAGTIYLKNDGVDALSVHAELRDGPDPTTNSVVTQLDGNDIDGTWALELVNVDTGALADTPLVQMTAGVIDVSYTTTIAPCEVELAEGRLQPIGGYTLRLAQTVRFKIVRALS